MAGYVYLILHGEYHKIGVSGRPDVRLSVVAPGGTLLHLIPSLDPFGVERALHRHFEAKRVRGEWFMLSEQDVRLLRSVARADRAGDLPDALRCRALPSVVVSLELPAGLARALRRVASGLGMSEGEVVAALLTAHLSEYDRLAAEVLRKRQAG